MSFRNAFPSLVLLTAFLLAPSPARANRDAVQFGSTIVVGPNETVHDAVCFFCGVDAKGSIDHDVVVFFGNVHIATHSNHDVVVFFGNVRLDPDATVTHDLVNFFGTVHLGENASVGNDMVSMFGSVRTADSASIAGNRVVQPGWVLWIPLIIIGGIVALIVSAVRNYHARQMYAGGYPYPPPPPRPPMPPTPPQA
jgi:hypothetical protein